MILDLHRQGLSVSAIARQPASTARPCASTSQRGLEPPAYGPRKPRPDAVRAVRAATCANGVAAFPEPTGRRLLRELRERGYAGGYTAVTDLLRELRPPPARRLRGPLRDAARRSGPGRLRPLPGDLHRRAGRRPDRLAVLDGARP